MLITAPDPTHNASPSLAMALQAMQTRFPEPRRVPFNYAYGDTAVAAKYIGLPAAPGPIVGEWQHGVVVAERNCHADWIVGGDGLSHLRRSKRYFVARVDQQAALERFGYSDVHAIGLPFAYVNSPACQRVPSSLLAMPAHGLPEIGSRVVEAYADHVATQRRYFRDVVVCLHIADFRDDIVRRQFEQRDIAIIAGADPEDATAYERLAELFARFDVVTTNEFGSHIPYAAWCGARVSVAGPRPAFERQTLEKLPFYRNNPVLLDKQEEIVREGVLERSYPFLYTEPCRAAFCRDWAAHQIGVRNRRSPRHLRSLLGWSLFRSMLRDTRATIRHARARLRHWGGTPT